VVVYWGSLVSLWDSCCVDLGFFGPIRRPFGDVALWICGIQRVERLCDRVSCTIYADSCMC
jgi:hypothetical protein